jgi:hypothetical protein
MVVLELQKKITLLRKCAKMKLRGMWQVGFKMGIPRVGISQTVPGASTDSKRPKFHAV